MLEVAHAALGMTRSSPALTFVQIFSRFMVVAFLNCCPEQIKSDTTWIPALIIAWSLADFTRYVFYCFGLARDIAGSCRGVAVALKLMKVKSVERADDPVFKIPFPLVWVRYSLFIVNYPFGVFCELMCIWMTRECALAAIASTQPATISGWVLQTLKFVLGGLGLQDNLTRYYGVILLCYIFGLPPLYFSLVAARKNQLGKPKQKINAAKKNQ